MTARVMNLFESIGFSWLVSIMKLFTLQNPKEQIENLIRTLGVPLFAFAVFLGIWHMGASQIETSLGKVPGPAAGPLGEPQRPKAARWPRRDARSAKTIRPPPWFGFV